MHALIIFDTMYGNTEAIARAIGAGMGEDVTVDVRTISEVEALPPELDLLIIGSPTQAHGVDAPMKAFLDRLSEQSVRDLAAATFDTRLRWPKLLSGAASQGIAQRLEHKGARIVVEPESFIVSGKEGPLLEGERERALAWGHHLRTLVGGAGDRQEHDRN